MDLNAILVTAKGFAEMHSHLKNNQKIAAIKALRAAATPPPGEKSLGLREAKYAVERYCYDKLGQQNMKGAVAEGKIIVASPIIKEIICDFGTGPVTMSVEDMELRALTHLESLGLEACGRMLELCEVIRSWGEGKKVGVIEGDNHGEG